MENKSEIKPILYYFPFNSKAGIIRAILYSQSIDFINETFSYKEYNDSIKQDKAFEYGQVPAYQENNKVFTQSYAIIMYLADKYNLHGRTIEETYEINNLLLSYEDFRPLFIPGVYPNVNEEEAVKFLEESAPKYLQIYEAKLLHLRKNINDDYIINNTFSLADIYLSFVIYYIFRHPSRRQQYEPVLLKYAPNLAEYTEKIENKELKSFFAKSYNKEYTF